MQTPSRYFVLFALVTIACDGGPQSPFDVGEECAPVASNNLSEIPACLERAGIIAEGDRVHADSVFTDALRVRDSVAESDRADAFTAASSITTAAQHVTDFYARGLFDDSTRFNRMVDHIAITIDYVTGQGVTLPSSNFAPVSTPYLIAHVYPGIGVFIQPVSTIQTVTSILSRPEVSTDSVVAVANAIYRNAIWHESPLGRIPIWEYQFTATTGSVTLLPPWRSGMAQGLALVLFTDAWQRTGDEQWKARAFDVFRSMQVAYNDGGVRLDDTTHGFWWLEYHPTVMVWNGAVQALAGIVYFAYATQDPVALEAAARGIEAVKYYTPAYDPGFWTYYSRTQGLNTRFYHNFHIQLCDKLYEITGDPWFKETADRWRNYTPPPGVN